VGAGSLSEKNLPLVRSFPIFLQPKQGKYFLDNDDGFQAVTGVKMIFLMSAI
jgi:hypothetical protein